MTPDDTKSSAGDLLVIGGGPAGYAAALAAAHQGLSVTLVDEWGIGGTCLHRGCIPAKHFLEAAATMHHIRDAGRFGIAVGEPTLDFAATQAAKNSLVAETAVGLTKLLTTSGVRVIAGRASVLSEQLVSVATETAIMELEVGSVVLATGSVPRAIDVLPVDGNMIVNSDGFLDRTELPRHAVIVGGGAIGCEFASLLADLGASVTVIEAMPTILAGCDSDVSRLMTRVFKKRGIAISTGVTVTGHETLDTEVVVHLSNGSSVTGDLVVVAVGRSVNLDGVVDPRIEPDRDANGALLTNAHQQTSIPSMYAVGDVVAGTPQLAHVGFAEALVAVGHLCGRELEPVNYDGVAWAIYTRPEVAFLGLTEDQARARGYEIVVKRDPVGGNSRAKMLGSTDGMAKVICVAKPDGSAGRVLGVHLVGAWVTEQLGGANLAVNLGLDVEQIATFLTPHPSLTETYGETLLALAGRGIHVH